MPLPTQAAAALPVAPDVVDLPARQIVYLVKEPARRRGKGHRLELYARAVAAGPMRALCAADRVDADRTCRLAVRW